MRLVFAILVFCLSFFLTGSVSAQDTEVIYDIISVNNADVHSGPDFIYPVIGRFPRNASVIVLGRAGDFISRWDGRLWLEVDLGGRSGWIFGRLLRTSLSFNSIPPTGRILPRDRNGRVPEVFDFTTNVCNLWHGDFTLSGSILAGDAELATRVDPGRITAGPLSLRVRATAPRRILVDAQAENDSDRYNYNRIFSAQWEAQSGSYRITAERLSCSIICDVVVLAS